MLGQKYVVNDAGGVINMGSFLNRLAPKKYTADKDGFILLSEKNHILGTVRIKNQSMRVRAEARIIEFVGSPCPPPIVIPAPAKASGILDATKDRKTKFVVAISCYENAVAIFLPAALIDLRFSCVYVDGKFLVSRDPAGVVATKSTIERCICSYSMREWFPNMKFPLFNQYKLEVVADDNSFEIPLLVSHMAELLNPSPIIEDSQTQALEKDEELPRDKAKRYIRWLNEFSEQNDYTIKSEGNKLVLERNDRIA